MSIRRPRKIGIGGRFVRLRPRSILYRIALEILDKETPLARKVALVEVGLAMAIIRSELMLNTPIPDKTITSIPHFEEIEKSEGVRAPTSIEDIKRWARELLQKIRREGLSDPYNTIYNIAVILAAISFVQEPSSVEEA
jgi:hypothetical protein